MSRNIPQYSVLIIDYMNFDSPTEVPYLFAQAGFYVTVFCDHNSWVLQNSFFDEHIICKSKQPELFANQVIELVQSGNYDQICMVDDVAIRIMNEYVYDDELALKMLPISKIEHKKFLGSKSEFSKFCREHSIPTPEFEIYSDGCHVGFPVVVKIDQSQGGKGVVRCNNEHEFNQVIEKLSDQEKERLVIQKYIQGVLLGIEAYFYKGKLLASACSSVVETVGGEFSISSERVYRPIPELEPIIKKFGEELGAHGFASISFVQEECTGRYYMFEFDSRTNAWFRLAQRAGVDFSQAIAAGLEHKDILIVQKPERITVWQFPRDFIRSVMKRDVKGILGWLFNRRGRWRMVPWYDLKLLFGVITRALRSMVQRIKKSVL